MYTTRGSEIVIHIHGTSIRLPAPPAPASVCVAGIRSALHRDQSVSRPCLPRRPSADREPTSLLSPSITSGYPRSLSSLDFPPPRQRDLPWLSTHHDTSSQMASRRCSSRHGISSPGIPPTPPSTHPRSPRPDRANRVRPVPMQSLLLRANLNRSSYRHVGSTSLDHLGDALHGPGNDWETCVANFYDPSKRAVLHHLQPLRTTAHGTPRLGRHRARQVPGQ